MEMKKFFYKVSLRPLHVDTVEYFELIGTEYMVKDYLISVTAPNLNTAKMKAIVEVMGKVQPRLLEEFHKTAPHSKSNYKRALVFGSDFDYAAELVS